MRDSYKHWRREMISLFDDTESRLSRLNEIIAGMFHASIALIVARDSRATNLLLSQAHESLRKAIRSVYLEETNAMVYIGEALLSAKVNARKLADFDTLAKQIDTAIHLGNPPTFSPLRVVFKPQDLSSNFADESFFDQIGFATTATVEDTAGDVVLIYDCLSDSGLWRIQMARRSFVCDVADGQPIDPVERRKAEEQINLYLLTQRTVDIPSTFPLPQRSGMSFVTTGELVSGSLVTLFRVGSSVAGFRPKQIEQMSTTAYTLPQEYDIGLILSTNACEALLASLLTEYETSPENAGFFNEDYFHKTLGKNLDLCIDASNAGCVPNENALSFNVPFGAKYEATTWGKDWNVDIGGLVPVICTFATTYTVDAARRSTLVVQVQVKQNGPLKVLSTDLHGGLIGDVLKSVTSIVEDKVHSLSKDLPPINATVPFFTMPSAVGSTPHISGKNLIIEVKLNDKSAALGGLE
jgi:hypothetical protein